MKVDKSIGWMFLFLAALMAGSPFLPQWILFIVIFVILLFQKSHRLVLMNVINVE